MDGIGRVGIANADDARDENQNGRRRMTGLHVGRAHVVLDRPEALEFFDNAGGALELLPLKGEHRIVRLNIYIVIIWLVIVGEENDRE